MKVDKDDANGYEYIKTFLMSNFKLKTWLRFVWFGCPSTKKLKKAPNHANLCMYYTVKCINVRTLLKPQSGAMLVTNYNHRLGEV